MKQPFIYTLLVFTLFIGCGGPKELSEFEQLPGWAKSRPLVSDAYVGIGHAKKLGTSTEYIKTARENALADLASEISVKVSATSVLHSLETEAGLSETMYTKNKLTANDYFEGFEPVAYYDGPTEYWVYYKIDKQLYLQKKEERKTQAIDKALSLYKEGIEAESSRLPITAFSNYMKALEALKEYYNESLEVTFEDKSINLGTTILEAIETVKNDIKVEAIISDHYYKRGQNAPNPVDFRVLYKNLPVANIPLKFSYSGGYLNDNTATSSSDGTCSVLLNRLTSSTTSGTITAQVDFYQLARMAVKDIYLRNYSKKLSSEKFFANIYIQSPSVSIQSPKSYINQVISSVKKHEKNYGYTVTHKSDADLKISTSITEVKRVVAGNGIVKVKVEVKCTLTPSGDNTPIERVSFVDEIGKTYDEVANKAKVNAIAMLDARLIPDVLDSYFR